jgi:NADH-quinone oxidoreductase subunit K
MSIELVLLSVNFFFLTGSVYLDDRVGQIFTLFILTVAAAETSIGLAILVAFYRIKGTIAVAFVNRLKG